MAIRLSNTTIDQKLYGYSIRRLDDCSNAKITDKVMWSCLNCGHAWKTTIRKIVWKETGCPQCAGNIKLSNAIIDQRLINRDIRRIGDYVNANSKIEWQCLNCKYMWITTPRSVVDLKTGCPFCAGNLRLTNQIIDQKLIGRNIQRIENYNGAHLKILWNCMTCNYEWSATPGHILNGGRGCPRCANNIRLTNEIIDQRLINRSIKRIGEYYNSCTKIDWQCLTCMHRWKALPPNVVSLEKGCPKCSTIGINEALMISIFHQYNLEFEPHYSIRNIDNVERNLIFDTYFPLIKLAIEYNGKQHYIPTGFFNSDNPEEEFKKQQERDEYKRLFCKRNSIQLIEIDGRKFYNERLKKYLIYDVVPMIKEMGIK